MSIAWASARQVKRKPLESLGQTKPEHFGEALRAAAIAEFGSGKAFAKAVGVSPGRISQIVNGREEIEATTLGKLLGTFTLPHLQERVHAAWTRQFAPRPESEDDYSDPADGLLRILALTEAGLPVRALDLARTWQVRTTNEPRWYAFSQHVVELSLRLAKVSSALAEVQNMESVAISKGDRLQMANVLWLKGLVLRNLDRATAKMLSEAHRDAVQFTEAYDITSQTLPGIEEQLARDFALHLVMLNERRPLPYEALRYALKLVSDSVDQGLDGVLLAHALEIRARIEIALGQATKAEDTLEEVESISVSRATDVSEATMISQAKILIARGDQDEAKSILERVAEISFSRMNLHHQDVAEQLLSRLLLGQR